MYKSHQAVEFNADKTVEVNGYSLNEYGEVELTEEQYNDLLDETNEMVTVCSMEYYPSTVLQAVDPIAYNCGKSDYESSLQSDIDEELDEFIEEVQQSLTSLFESDTETDSDYLWNRFGEVADLFAHYTTPDNRCELSRQIRETLEIEPGEMHQGFTFNQIKQKALEMLSFNPDLYCNAVSTDSYFSHPDSVLSVNVGEIEYQIEEYSLEYWPKWFIDKVNRSSDFTVNNGFAYFICNGAELILKDKHEFFEEVLQELREESEEDTNENNGE